MRNYYKRVSASLSKILLVVSVAFILATVGCGHPWEDRIKSTKKQYKAADIRRTLLPLFTNYHFDPKAVPWGPPNYLLLSPIPKEVAVLPLFKNLEAHQQVCMGALENDTNAFIIFTESTIDKWGIVVHRYENTKELPLVSGQEFTLWDHGVFFLCRRQFSSMKIMGHEGGALLI